MQKGIKESSDGVVIAIKVVPKSHRNEIVGWENEELKVKIAAVPEKGNANDTLIRFLAKCFQMPHSRLVLTHGDTSRHKRICIKSATLIDIEALLPKLPCS